MNNDKLTTIDDEILDGVSGGAQSIGEAVGQVIDGSIAFVEAVVDYPFKRRQEFLNKLQHNKMGL